MVSTSYFRFLDTFNRQLTCFKWKVARDDSKKQSQTVASTVASTVHVDVSQAKQFTVDYVDGTFVLMKRQNTRHSYATKSLTTDINVNTTED